MLKLSNINLKVVSVSITITYVTYGNNEYLGKETFENIANNSTFHGVNWIISSQDKLSKLFWSVFLLISVVLSVQAVVYFII